MKDGRSGLSRPDALFHSSHLGSEFRVLVDEDIPTTNTSPVRHEEQVDSTKKKDDEIRIGPITRARAKLIEQQVNSLLIDSDILCNENFILPKSLYVCIIRYNDEEEDPEGGEDEEISNFRTSDVTDVRTPSDVRNCLRVDQTAAALVFP